MSLFAPEITRDTDAERVYAAYPRKVAKADALKAIRKALNALKKANKDIEWLIGQVEAYAASPAGKAGHFTPHPATWFNRGSYDDDPSEWARGFDQRTNDNVERLRIRELEAKARRDELERDDRLALSYVKSMTAEEQLKWVQKYIHSLPETIRDWFKRRSPAEMARRPLIAQWIMQNREADGR